MDTKYLKRVGIYILSVILALFLVAYIVYHLMDGFTTDITTVGAEISNRKNVISSDGYIFRDEHCLSSSYSGAVNYLVSDGEKVAIDQAVAESFSDAASYSVGTELEEIENKLSILGSSEVPAGAANSDTHIVDKNITDSYYMILSGIASGKYSHAVRSTDSLLVQMNRRNMIIGEVESYKPLISQLENRKLSLSSRLSGKSETVRSDVSGYFFTSVDGYESIFSPDVLDKMTVDSFEELISRSPESKGNEIGKISESYIWYIAVPMSTSDAASLRTDRVYKAVFPYNYDTELSLTVYRIITSDRDDKAVAIFSTGEMPEGFAYLRSQQLEIILSESVGFRVPATAVRLLDGIKGVYTLHGSTVVFKRIDILMESDGYYIVSVSDPEKSENAEKSPKYPYLELYDRIIVSGKDLKDGMVFY